MKKLALGAILLTGIQAFACADLVGTYYCGKAQNGYPDTVYRVSRSGGNLEIEAGLFGGSEMVVRKQPGTGSLAQKKKQIASELTRCSSLGNVSTISMLSRISDGESFQQSLTTHLVKRGEQISIHYASVNIRRGGITERKESQESCRKVSMSEDAWTRTKAAAELVIGLVTGKGPY